MSIFSLVTEDSGDNLGVAVNTFVWIVSNLLVFVIFVAAATFAIGYPAMFKISTTGGWRLWRAILSLAGFALLAVLGIFVDPTQVPWYELPPDVAWWRPLIRIAVFGLIATSFGSLSWYLIQRRFFPQKLVIRPEVTQLMESELRLRYGSGEGLPDPHKVAILLTEDGWTKAGLDAPPVNTLGVIPRQFGKRSRR